MTEQAAVSVPETMPELGTTRATAVLSEDINREHRLARQSAENAVEHAIRCGQLLLAKKEELRHGEFLPWVKANCEFEPRRAQQYMQGALKCDPRIAFASVRQLLQHGQAHRTETSGNQEWYTPPEYLSAARRVLDGIDLDPASSEQAQAAVGARKFYTKEQDGLKRQWKGRVFLNPPYSNPECGQFIDKLIAEIGALHVTEAVLLVNNCTETEWFQKSARIAAAICFPSKRISYLNPEGERVGSPTQGQAFMYFGTRAVAFAEQFEALGLLLRPM